MTIDINLLRGVITALLLCAFLGVVFWAYSGKRRRDFNEAAALPLQDNDQAEAARQLS